MFNYQEGEFDRIREKEIRRKYLSEHLNLTRNQQKKQEAYA